MKTDTVTLSVLRSRFTAIAESMGYALERSAHSTFVKESADFATGLATLDGEFFAYPRVIGVSSFVGLTLTATVDAVGELEPGDIIITNDPYGSAGLATHLPDIHLIRPLFHDSVPICYAWCFIHCADVGGLTPASVSPRAEDIQQEGFRIPPRKLCRAGVVDEEFMRAFFGNSRSPAHNRGDLQAMVGSLVTGERRVAELVAQIGPKTFCQAAADMLEWTELRARNQIARLPDGQYGFVDYLDDDGQGAPVRLVVTIDVHGDEVRLDYTGSDPQVESALNLPGFGPRHPFLAQGMVNYILSEEPDMPLTGGIMRPITTWAPPGSVLNPQYPAAVGVRYATVIRLYNVVLGALAKAVPGRVPAAGSGAAAVVMLSTPDLTLGGRHVAVLEPLQGGGGATAIGDGVAGNDSAVGFLRNTPVESLEYEVPVLIERYELLADSAGPGQHRGGFGTRFDFRVLLPESVVTARGMERCRFEPWGLAGGRPSRPTRAFINPGTDREIEIGRIDVLRCEPGDVISVWTSGGAGYGEPLRRQVEAVAADHSAGLLSAEAARHGYGVVFADGAVDRAATARLRLQRSDSEIDGVAAMGPVRRSYEAMWPEELAAALVELLFTLPQGLRSFAKREIRRRVEASSTPVAATALREIWSEIARARLQARFGGS